MSEGLINKKDKDSQLKFMHIAYPYSFSNISQQNIDNRLMQKKMKIFNTIFEKLCINVNLQLGSLTWNVNPRSGL